MPLGHCRTSHVFASWLLLCLLLCVLLTARTAAADPAVAIAHRLAHYVVETSGAYQLTVDDVRTVAAAQAVRDQSRYAIAYDKSRDDVVAIEAYTLKPDGRRVPAPGNVHLGVVEFPDLAVGDQTVVRYVIRRHTPLFAGQFDDLVTVPFGRVGSFQVIVDMPPGMPLHADAAGFVAVPAAHPPGRTRYGWRYAGGDDVRIEAGAVSAVDAGRRLAVSTFAGYPAFAAAFRQVMAGKALATPAVAALARQLTSNLPDAHARALALAGWVRSNVRLSGSDGLGPHDAASVLTAMLAAVGIESTPALVNHGNAYRLPDAPTLGVFNHMITYVPGLDLYLDPTFDAPDPAALPSGILGKPALLLETGTFAMTPLLQPRRTVTAATVDIDAGRLPSRVAAGGDSGRSAVVEAIRDMTVEPERHQDYVCPAVDAEDATRLRLPQGARILALPRSMQLMDGGIYYSARYVREGGLQGDTVLAQRRLTFRHGRPTCSPADYRAMRPALERIVRDLRSQVVVTGGRAPGRRAILAPSVP